MSKINDTKGTEKIELKKKLGLVAATGETWGGNFIAFGAIISTLGSTSGWIRTTARSAYGASQDKLFPGVFGRIHPKYKTPVASLLISGVAANILLIMNYVSSLNSAFNFMILLATLAFLPAYSFAAAADIVLLKKHSLDFKIFNFLKNSFVALLLNNDNSFLAEKA